MKELNSIRKMRKRPRDQAAQYLGRVLKKNTDRGDELWVWGRWAWPVYYHAEMQSPTPYYKVLGLITTTLNNTWKRSGEPTRFVRRAFWEELIEQLESWSPAFIVTSRNEDYQEFTEFKQLLKTQYRRVPQAHSRRFELFRHRDHPLKDPPRVNSSKKIKKRKKPTKTKKR